MTVSAIGKRYAKALLELATEQRAASRIGLELSELRTTWNANASLQSLFENPSVLSEQRRAVLEDLSKRMGLSPITRNTLMMLSDRQRMAFVPDIADAYEALREETEGRVVAEVTSAAPLTEAYVGELQRTLERITGKKVSVTKSVDPSLIAGVVTRVGDKVFDGSLKSRLSEIEGTILAR